MAIGMPTAINTSAEVEDNVDLTPEVAVGRVPASNYYNDVQHFIEKWNAYESSGSLDWQNKAVFLGSEMFRYRDGKEFSQDLAGTISRNMVITEMYDDTGGTASKTNFLQEINAGRGLVVLHGLAQNSTNFFLHRSDTWDILQLTDIDGLTNSGKPSVVFAATCWNNQLDHNCMAKHWINYTTGGAVAYVGSSYNDYVYRSHPLAKTFFTQLFGTGPKEIGKLLNISKESILSSAGWDGAGRHNVFGYQLLGDPQMCIWTDVPKQMAVSPPNWVFKGIGPQTFNVTVTSLGNPLGGVVVCASHYPGLYDWPDVYSVATSDSNGVAHFANVYIPNISIPSISVAATKAGFLSADTSIRVTAGGVPGDADSSAIVNISDAYYVINYVFGEGPPPLILNRGDADGNCTINISDVVYLIGYVFNGTPIPIPGCVTSPPGGKRRAVDGDPTDNEGIPVDLAETGEITVSPISDSPDSYVLRVNSQHRIHGLSVTLRASGENKVGVENLMQADERMDVYWKQDRSLVKIGLVDVKGKKFIRTGEKDILRVTGRFTISYILASEVTSDGKVVTLRPQFSDPVDSSASPGFSFEPNYPNPFNPETSISFAVPYQSHVRLEIFNILGQNIRTLLDATVPQGRHVLIWDGKDKSGIDVGSGVYFSRFNAGEFEAKRKMLIVK